MIPFSPPLFCSQKFTKSQRLLTPNQFRQVFDFPDKKYHQDYFLMFVKDTKHSKARLGLAITKKKVSRAVVRNRLKRLIREQFRLYYELLLARDVVFIVKKPIFGVDDAILVQQIQSLLKKIEKNCHG